MSDTNTAIEILRRIARRAGTGRVTLTLSTFDLAEIRSCVQGHEATTDAVCAVDPVAEARQEGATRDKSSSLAPCPEQEKERKALWPAGAPSDSEMALRIEEEQADGQARVSFTVRCGYCGHLPCDCEDTTTSAPEEETR